MKVLTLIMLILATNAFATLNPNQEEIIEKKIDREKLLEYPIYSRIEPDKIDMGMDHA